MNQFIVKVVLEAVLEIVAAVLIRYLCLRFSNPPSFQEGSTIYSVNRFMKYFIFFGGIAMVSLFFGLYIFIAVRDGIQHWGTLFIAALTLAFSFIFMKALQEICVTYEVQKDRLSVITWRRQSAYELSNLELISETQAGLLLRDPWGDDFLVSSYMDGYADLKQHILAYVRNDR